MQSDRALLPTLVDVSPALWQKLSDRTIYFGHQSVGDNILGGVAKILAQEPAIRLEIVKSSDPARWDRPALAHFAVGTNGDPDSKTRAFAAAMRAGGGKADIAFFKFCFWDIRSTTDAAAVFRRYRDTMSALRREYPAVVFVHVTVPLTIHRDGLTQRLKSLLGKADAWDLDNLKRAELNDLLMKEYQGREPIFDLARAESTLQDGRRTVQMIGGRPAFALAPGYSRDGAHLNDDGARWVAVQFLIALARATGGTPGG